MCSGLIEAVSRDGKTRKQPFDVIIKVAVMTTPETQNCFGSHTDLRNPSGGTIRNSQAPWHVTDMACERVSDQLQRCHKRCRPEKMRVEIPSTAERPSSN